VQGLQEHPQWFDLLKIREKSLKIWEKSLKIWTTFLKIRAKTAANGV